MLLPSDELIVHKSSWQRHPGSCGLFPSCDWHLPIEACCYIRNLPISRITDKDVNEAVLKAGIRADPRLECSEWVLSLD